MIEAEDVPRWIASRRTAEQIKKSIETLKAKNPRYQDASWAQSLKDRQEALKIKEGK